MSKLYKTCTRCRKQQTLDRFHRNGTFSRRSECLTCASVRQRERRYNLQKGEYAARVIEQGGECLICRKRTKLVVDHDHKTGQVRGLLCHQCNKGLGHFEDSAFLLRRAVDYLNRAP